MHLEIMPSTLTFFSLPFEQAIINTPWVHFSWKKLFVNHFWNWFVIQMHCIEIKSIIYNSIMCSACLKSPSKSITKYFFSESTRETKWYSLASYCRIMSQRNCYITKKRYDFGWFHKICDYFFCPHAIVGYVSYSKPL